MSENLEPIFCSTQCSPSCQFHWIKPDGSVVDGSILDIPSISKNDHGSFTCHTGNSYDNNVTKNLQLTVNCKYFIFNTITPNELVKRIDSYV
jgi:hypothetical protein